MRDPLISLGSTGMAAPSPGFDPYLARWRLAPDGPPILTPTSRLLPVRQAGVPAMLKVTDAPEERFGNGLMAWWDGDGAARVIAMDAGAVLLERAEGHCRSPRWRRTAATPRRRQSSATSPPGCTRPDRSPGPRQRR